MKTLLIITIIVISFTVGLHWQLFCNWRQGHYGRIPWSTVIIRGASFAIAAVLLSMFGFALYLVFVPPSH